LFAKGYLHRDISIGNILARDKPQERTPAMIEKNDAILSNQDCLGFIIDGDLAIEWEEHYRPVKHCPGTLPFISYRILDAWSINKPTLHTAIDDLESFAWVVLFAAL
ncbi:hypothetical protein JB92DRAFT_2639550, partial [Gautieria morchelliformis]